MAVGRTLCLLLASAAVVSPAFAQTPVRDAAPDRSADRWKAHRAEREAGREAHERQRAADIALLLRLKPEQQTAFQALEASLKPPGGERQGWRREGDAGGAPSTTVQSLDRMQAKMTEHEARMRARLDATRKFYASLSPEQQGLFDALMRLRHGGGEGGRRHGPDGGPPMMRGEGPGMDDGMGPPPPPPGG